MAASTLDQMVAIGRAKLVAKRGLMEAKYNAKKPVMIAKFDALPFGPTMKNAYRMGVEAAQYRAPDPDAWARGFRTGVSV